jgi:hypothetical protein
VSRIRPGVNPAGRRASALLPSVTLAALGAPAPGEPDGHDSGHFARIGLVPDYFVHIGGPALAGAEDVPALVERKVAVPYIRSLPVVVGQSG